jgi:hypothetical protein
MVVYCYLFFHLEQLLKVPVQLIKMKQKKTWWEKLRTRLDIRKRS